MADLNDVWNWPNNSGNGYATDSADWSGNASFGIDKRVDDIRTYTYTAHNTGALHYTNNLSRTTSSINTGFAAYKHYFDSHGDDTNPTFHQFAKYPAVEWNIQPNGRTIAGVHYELNSNNMPQVKVQFTHAHNFANSDQIEFFGFDTDSGGAAHRNLNMIKPYVSVVDGFNVILYEDSGLTRLAQVDNLFKAQSDVFFTALDDGSYNGVVAHFDIFQETFSTGDVLQIADTFANMGAGTLSSASSGTLVYLEEISGSNSYKLFSDSGRTTPFTLTGGQGVDLHDNDPGATIHGIQINIASSGSTVPIQVDLSSAGFNAVRTGIKSQNMTPETSSENTSNIYRGFCRVELTLGSGVSKAIPAYDVSTTVTKSAYFGYKYNDTTKVIDILTDPTITGRDSSLLTATNATGVVAGQIHIIDFWTYRNESTGTYSSAAQYFDGDLLPASGTNVGGLFFTGQVNDTSLNPVSPLTHPLASEATTLYSGTKPDGGDDNGNFNMLIYQLFSTVTRSPGTIKYQYQNSSNATVNGAVYDFTKFWRPGATSAFTPTYVATPTATPDLSTQGYIDGTSQLDVFPQRGLFTLAGLGLTSSTDVHNNAILSGSPAKPSSHVIEKVGVFPINAKADEYVAPATYAPDDFDTDDEWDTDGFDNRKNWPTHITPNGINITQTIPSSTTLSQNGTKYVRSSGVIKHQLEVSYPPMVYDDFRQFEAVHQAARGQATPFFFIIKQGGSSLTSNLIWQRTDTANSNLNTLQLRLRQDITAGTKTFLLEGFRASDTNCFIRGECLIVPSSSSNNGSIRHVINDNVTSNKYGEAKIRFAVGMNITAAGKSFYKNPFSLRVTMSEDALEYEVGTDGLYRFTCRFDLDEFK